MEGICERIEALLRERCISGSRMSADLGMSRSFMTELRKGRAKGVSAENAARIAQDYVREEFLLAPGKSFDVKMFPGGGFAARITRR